MTAIRLTTEQSRELMKKKKQSRTSGEATATTTTLMGDSQESKKKKDKKKKKEKRLKKCSKRESTERDQQELVVSSKNDEDDGNDKKRKLENTDLNKKNCDEERERKEKEKRVRKEKRKQHRLEKLKLWEKLPKTDEHGIAYTKLQLRRMQKRVARGLDPIETEAEKQERLKRDAELRREEEAELADMLHEQPDDAADDDDHTDVDTNVALVDDVVSDDPDHLDKEVNEDTQPTEETPAKSEHSPKKKTRRSKPVPADYVCSACQNKHTPAHWIYDCPDKVTMRGTNQVAKRLRGIHNPDSRKVFVSGLPFDAKARDVEHFFVSCGPVAHCKLITFEDTGRCKGQAYVTFTTDESARKALELSGSTIDNEVSSNSTKTAKTPPAGKRKELKLKVTKALNRIKTRRKA